MNDKVGDIKYRSVFSYHVYFIHYYLAMQLRKEKFDTDGAYESIFIDVGEEDGPDSIKDNSVWKFISINIKFDFERYNNSDEIERCKYYIELYKEALVRASRVATIPYERIAEYLDKLVQNNYVYTWKFSHLILRQYGLKIYFTARLTTNDFTIYATVYKGKDKEPLCHGRVIRTKPDSIHFDHISRKIYMENGKVFMGTRWDTDLLYLNISDLCVGHFVLHQSEPPSNINNDSKEQYRRFQKNLMYNGHDFE